MSGLPVRDSGVAGGGSVDDEGGEADAGRGVFRRPMMQVEGSRGRFQVADPVRGRRATVRPAQRGVAAAGSGDGAGGGDRGQTTASNVGFCGF